MSGQYFAKSNHQDVANLFSKKAEGKKKKTAKTKQQVLCRKDFDAFVGRLGK